MVKRKRLTIWEREGKLLTQVSEEKGECHSTELMFFSVNVFWSSLHIWTNTSILGAIYEQDVKLPLYCHSIPMPGMIFHICP